MRLYKLAQVAVAIFGVATMLTASAAIYHAENVAGSSNTQLIAEGMPIKLHEQANKLAAGDILLTKVKPGKLRVGLVVTQKQYNDFLTAYNDNKAYIAAHGGAVAGTLTDDNKKVVVDANNNNLQVITFNARQWRNMLRTGVKQNDPVLAWINNNGYYGTLHEAISPKHH